MLNFGSIWFKVVFAAILILCLPHAAKAADCYESTIMFPSPFMGNNDEVFKLADGSIWQVKYEYEYLYAYYPNIVICPSRGMLSINGKTLNVIALSPAAPHSKALNRPDAPAKPQKRPGTPANAITVVYRQRGCDYFVADGPNGYYLLEWYGGFDPQVGDTLVGYETGYGFKDVLYVQSGSKGRVWADDYLLSRDSATEKMTEKCH